MRDGSDRQRLIFPTAEMSAHMWRARVDDQPVLPGVEVDAILGFSTGRHHIAGESLKAALSSDSFRRSKGPLKYLSGRRRHKPGVSIIGWRSRDRWTAGIGRVAADADGWQGNTASSSSTGQRVPCRRVVNHRKQVVDDHRDRRSGVNIDLYVGIRRPVMSGKPRRIGPGLA